jgi:formate dehydrogenase maturation protein FdhE
MPDKKKKSQKTQCALCSGTPVEVAVAIHINGSGGKTRLCWNCYSEWYDANEKILKACYQKAKP